MATKRKLYGQASADALGQAILTRIGEQKSARQGKTIAHNILHGYTDTAGAHPGVLATNPDLHNPANDAQWMKLGQNIADQTGVDLQTGQPKTSGPAAVPAAVAGVDPRDSSYFATIAQSAFNRDQQTHDLQAQQGYADADYAEAIRRLAAQRPVDEQKARLQANSEGRLLGSVLGTDLGDIATSYTRRGADARTAYDRDRAGRASSVEALSQGYGLDEASALADAVGRATTRDTTLADQGALPGPASPPPPAPTTTSAPSTAKIPPHPRLYGKPAWDAVGQAIADKLGIDLKTGKPKKKG